MTTLPAVLLIFSPPLSSQPPTAHCAGGSMPADSSIAGQYTQWWRMMSLPIRWRAGHQCSNVASSVPKPTAVR